MIFFVDTPRIVGFELESELSPQVCPPLPTARSTWKNAIWMHRSAQDRQCWLCKSSCLVYATSQDCAKNLDGSTNMRVLIISCIWLLHLASVFYIFFYQYAGTVAMPYPWTVYGLPLDIHSSVTPYSSSFAKQGSYSTPEILYKSRV